MTLLTNHANINNSKHKAKAEYERAYNKVTNLFERKDEKNKALEEIEKLEKELTFLRNKKEKKIDALAMVQVEYGYEIQRYDDYVKRGPIGQFFLGDKRVEREKKVEYIDSRAYDDAQKKIWDLAPAAR